MNLKNSIEKNLRIAGVIVLYNPDQQVVENISSYINDVEILYAVDNSETVNNKVIGEVKDIANQKIIYHSMNGNKGIGAALNYAADMALAEGFEWLLTMDQDSRATDLMVRQLISVSINSKIKNIGIITPFHINKYKTKSIPAEDFTIVDFEKTSGNLLNLFAYKNTGKFREDYFIDYVDIEYCMRLRREGYKIIRANRARLIHNEGNIDKKNFLFRTVYPSNHNPIRWYYKIRNLFYLRDEYNIENPEFFKKEIRKYFIQFLKILLYEREKLAKYKFIYMGIRDYRSNIKFKCLEG